MSVTVYCGLNGGEWEFYRDKSLWQCWLDRVMHVREYEMIDTFSNKITIVFEDESNDVIFKLKAPQYITLKDIPDENILPG